MVVTLAGQGLSTIFKNRLEFWSSGILFTVQNPSTKCLKLIGILGVTLFTGQDQSTKCLNRLEFLSSPIFHKVKFILNLKN
jgi:hypothetical protein